MSSDKKTKPRVAVFKFASCDGCQLSLLDAEDELLAVAGAIEIAFFPEAPGPCSRAPTTSGWWKAPSHAPRCRAHPAGPPPVYGAGNHWRLRHRRPASRRFAIGRQPGVRPHRLLPARFYPDPQDVHPHCGTRSGGFRAARLPINKKHLIELIAAMLIGRKPNTLLTACA